MPRPIVFLSDYGYADEYAGVCRGVIARIAPEATVIDLTHSIPPQDVVRGASVLAGGVQYMPDDAVYLAVVDPGVGSAREPVAVQASGGQILVGPDNGLLSLAWEEMGGASRAVSIQSKEVVLEPLSRTFHGRDVFAPAAAHLARGLALGDLGPEVAVRELQRVHLPDPMVVDGEVGATILSVDRFGNLQLNVRTSHLDAAGLGDASELDFTAAEATFSLRRAATFADVPPGDAALLVDSSGYAAVVVNEGNAAGSFGVGPGDPVTLAAPGRG